MKGLVLFYMHKGHHLLITRTPIHTDFGDQYSATMNACDLPSRLRTCLIFMMGHRECIRERDYELIGLLTHCKRNWRSICLMASRRKPVPPVVWSVIRQMLVMSEMEWNQKPAKPSQTTCVYPPVRPGAGSQPLACRVNTSFALGTRRNGPTSAPRR
jgi:hypothetical protein